MASSRTKPWAALNMTSEQAHQLAAVSRAHGIAPAAVTALRMYTFTASRGGRFDQSVQQIVERHGGLFSASQIRRALDTLSELGWLRTVEHPGRGRAAVRRLACFDFATAGESTTDTTTATVEHTIVVEPITARSTADHRAESDLSPRAHNAVTSGNAAFSESSLKSTTVNAEITRPAMLDGAVVGDDESDEISDEQTVVSELLRTGGWRALRDAMRDEQWLADHGAEIEHREQQHQRQEEQRKRAERPWPAAHQMDEMPSSTVEHVDDQRIEAAAWAAAQRYVAMQSNVRSRGAYTTTMRNKAVERLRELIRERSTWPAWVQYVAPEQLAPAVCAELVNQRPSPGTYAALDQLAAQAMHGSAA